MFPVIVAERKFSDGEPYWLVCAPLTNMRGEGRTLEEAKSEFRRMVEKTYRDGLNHVRGDRVYLDFVEVPSIEVAVVMGA